MFFHLKMGARTDANMYRTFKHFVHRFLVLSPGPGVSLEFFPTLNVRFKKHLDMSSLVPSGVRSMENSQMCRTILSRATTVQGYAMSCKILNRVTEYQIH